MSKKAKTPSAKTRHATPTGQGRGLAIVLALIFFALAGLRFDALRQRLGADRIVHGIEGAVKRAVAAGQTPPARVLRGQIELLEKAAELDPTHVGIPVSIGAHYYLMQRWPEARAAFERAAELEMRGEVYANLARCLMAEGDMQAGMEAARTAILLDHTQRKYFRADLERARRAKEAERRRATGLFVDGFEAGDTSSWTREGEAEGEQGKGAATSPPREPTEEEETP